MRLFEAERKGSEMTIGGVYVAMLLLALVATVTDTRTGRIPNWLTLPVSLLMTGPTRRPNIAGTKIQHDH